jgi:two-component system response regulator
MNIRRSGILLVEDDPNDEELTCRVLANNHLLNNTVVTRDGAEALDYVFGRGVYEGRDVMEQPIVVLLDLNLPKLSGLEVLQAIRADPRTHLLPVVILTSSRQDADLFAGYLGGVNSYVVKPVQFKDFSDVVKQLALYWVLANQTTGGSAPRPFPPSRVGQLLGDESSGEK